MFFSFCRAKAAVSAVQIGQIPVSTINPPIILFPFYHAAIRYTPSLRIASYVSSACHRTVEFTVLRGKKDNVRAHMFPQNITETQGSRCPPFWRNRENNQRLRDTVYITADKTGALQQRCAVPVMTSVKKISPRLRRRNSRDMHMHPHLRSRRRSVFPRY